MIAMQNPHTINADLHCHSTVSDGMLAPRDVAARAHAGGVAVMAHPGRYNYTATQHDALFDEFTQLGGRAVEVVTGSHTPDQFRRYADVARHYGLMASRGSDFHGPGEGRVDIGTLPPLPSDVTPVWHDW